MHRFFALSLLFAALGTPALAADLGGDYRASLKDDVPFVRPFNWTGFYVGANVGYGWAKGNGEVTPDRLAFGGLTPADTADLSRGFGWSPDGFIGGGQVGYNVQTGTLVTGIETDIQGGDLDQSRNVLRTLTAPPPPLVGAIQLRQTQKLNWFGTLRARVGVALQPTLLVYATGGLAYGGVSHSHFVRTPLGGATFAGSSRDTKVGWTLGGGAEWAIDHNWSLKAEYLYVDLGRSGYTGVNTTPAGGPVTDRFNARYETRLNVVRAGLNYKF